MNTETAGQYATRVIKARGQAAMDVERTIIYCYDNPPRKPLPKPQSARERQLWVSRRVAQCLSAITGYSGTDALAEAILLFWIKENAGEIYSMYERHDQEVAARLAELRQNEPGLQQEEPDPMANYNQA